MTDQTPSTALALPEPTSLAALFKSDGLSGMIATLEETARAEAKALDAATKKGRDGLKSLAFKVSQSKAELDRQGLALTEQARKEIDAVNAGRRLAKERLDALRDEIKKPALDWEEKEEARIARHKSALLVFGLDRTTALSPSAEIREVLAEVEQTTTGEEWDEYQPIAEAQRAQALTKLRADLAAAERSEAEREELARLRAAEEDRQRREAEERAAREAAEAERLAAEEAERRAKEEAEAAAKRLAERAANARAYINQIGLGLIGGKPQPFGILIYKLESELPSLIDDLGEHAADLQKLRIATYATVKEKMERQRAEEEAAAEALSTMADAATPAAIAEALIEGRIPHVKVML